MKSFDPTTLEIYRALYTSVAEEMGIALRRTAFSPNIKERRDYSCAVFDASGRVIAQGDHMPVHPGSMRVGVAAALRAVAMARGDVVALNDPFAGGTHLPVRISSLPTAHTMRTLAARRRVRWDWLRMFTAKACASRPYALC